jgi:hypothetical protein
VKPSVTAAEAIGAVRETLGVDLTVPARAWRVERLDRPGDAYYLVIVGEEGAARAVAAVDASGAGLMTSARLPERGSHPMLDAGEAITTAGLGPHADAHLVWRPSRASRSPLYPLWMVQAGAKTVYIDQQKTVWEALDPAGPGG